MRIESIFSLSATRVLQLSKRKLPRSSPALLMAPDCIRNCGKPRLGQRDSRCDDILLTVNRADIGGGQDSRRDKEVIDYLKAAIRPGVVPGPGVIKGSDEKRTVVRRWVPIGRFGDCHPGMVA